ncbi:MAG TPA: hypothetical protein VFO23_14105, partial [Steroidobacteraceae bacterium]|nr:hypothetical protein [Steroidobacteraceae bacterium]
MAVATRSPSLAPSVALVDARAALAEVAPRLAALVRSIRNPSAPALGEWNAGDVAVHLTHVWEVLPALAGGDGGSPIGS